MMSFRTMFDPERAEDLALTGSIRIGEECFVAEVKEKVLTVERGDAKSPDFAIAAPSAMPIAALVYGQVPPGALTEAGLKRVETRRVGQERVSTGSHRWWTCK